MLTPLTSQETTKEEEMQTEENNQDLDQEVIY